MQFEQRNTKLGRKFKKLTGLYLLATSLNSQTEATLASTQTP